MIRLTVNSSSDPEIHLYNKPTILIGSDINAVDLILTKKEIYPVHLSIISQNDAFFLINDHGDPFAAVNGNPFGKKKLKNGDLIELHGIMIVYENLEEKSPKEFPEVDADKEWGSDQAIPRPQSSFINFSLPFGNEIEALNQEELEQVQLDRYVKDLETQESAPKNNDPHSTHSSSIATAAQEVKPERKKPTSLKDDYLRDLDDDYPNKESRFPTDEPSHLAQAWKWIVLFIMSASMVAVLIGTIIYFSVSDKTDAEEIKAAQAVADLSIALTHAQLNHLYSHNPNWSDTEFLKSNLNAILPNTPSYAYQIDAQGKFNSSPYNLRIYTSANLSHFLLIAQPEPNVLHWIIPKAMIVVDSHSMELRTIKDVRSLNRLLANPDPLEGTSSKEISSLVKTGGLISLQTLAKESGRSDFTPPDALANLKPGAENYIYNAPRYYHLGHGVMEKIITLSTLKASSHEVATIKNEVANFCCLNSLIFYSTKGKQSAETFKQGLMLFAPSENFLYGYIVLNNKGAISQAHLLKDEGQPKEEREIDQLALKEDPPVAVQPKLKINEPGVDTNHPIYIKLSAKIAERQNEIKPIADELIMLINQEVNVPSPSFQTDYQDLSHHYLMADAKHKRMIKETLETLYLQYEEMPVNEFVTFLKVLNLHKLIHESEEDVAISDENTTQDIEKTFQRFESSKTLEELDHLIHRVTTLLNFDHIKDSDDLLLYQNQLRNLALAQLEKHILLSDGQRTAEDRDTLLHILDQERLIHPDEKEYFLEEFDRKDESYPIADDYVVPETITQKPEENSQELEEKSPEKSPESNEVKNESPEKIAYISPELILQKPDSRRETMPLIWDATAFMRNDPSNRGHVTHQ